MVFKSYQRALRVLRIRRYTRRAGKKFLIFNPRLWLCVFVLCVMGYSIANKLL